MKKITVILAHANFNKSIANKKIAEIIQNEYSNIDIRNLSEMYPDLKLGVEAEQENLKKSDIIILQFPVYWYNMPALMKLWMDKVLTYGFAYGENGDKLNGKTLVTCITAGGSKESYTPKGSMHFRLRQFFNNIESTAYYCGMNFVEPVLGYGNIYIPKKANSTEIVEKRASEQAQRLIATIDNLYK